MGYRDIWRPQGTEEHSVHNTLEGPGSPVGGVGRNPAVSWLKNLERVWVPVG